MHRIPLPRLQDVEVTLEGSKHGSMDIDTYLACCYLEANGWNFYVNYDPTDALEKARQRYMEFGRASQ
jgi:hypothetical protein